MKRIGISVTARFMASYFIAVILVAASGLVGITALRRAGDGLNEIVWRLDGVELTLRDVESGLRAADQAAAWYVAAGDDAYEAKLRDASAGVRDRLAQYLATDASDQADSVAETIPAVEDCLDRLADYAAAVRAGTGQDEAASAAHASFAAATASLRELLDREVGLRHTTQISIGQYESQTQTRLIWIGAVTAALVVVAFVVVRNVIGEPLRRLAESAQHVAGGDLTATAKVTHSGDEIELLGRAFNDMGDSLRELVAKVADVAGAVTGSADDLGNNTGDTAAALQQVAGAIGEVAAGTGQQSAHAEAAGRSVRELRSAIETVAVGAQQQVSHVQQSVSTIKQMVQHQEQLSEIMEQIRADSSGSAAASADGLQAIRQLATGMDQIRAATEQSMARLEALSSSATKVSTINDVITDIAEQTNLLALNAAIEAARAGEQGRGFAVVADEVRKLAERAASSAKEITDLISTIQRDTGHLVEAMGQSAQATRGGLEMATKTGEVLESVAAIVGRTAETVGTAHSMTVETARAAQEAEAATMSVAAIAEQSSASAEEMAAGSDQVLGLVGEVAALAGNNAASAEEVSASVEEVTATMDQVATAAGALRQMAQELREAIMRFRV